MDERIQQEIAALAAEMIAEFNLDYSTAKRKAARQVLGTDRPDHAYLPSNDLVEAAVREYQSIYQAETQPERLLSLRRTALGVMQVLPQWQLFLVGAVANGTANEHSAIYFQCHADSSKDLHIDLLNRGIEAEADEIPNPFGKGMVERVSFDFEGERIHITCYAHHQARQMGAALAPRLDRSALEQSLTGLDDAAHGNTVR